MFLRCIRCKYLSSQDGGDDHGDFGHKPVTSNPVAPIYRGRAGARIASLFSQSSEHVRFKRISIVYAMILGSHSS